MVKNLENRKLNKRNFWIAVQGPDGAGKGTVISMLDEILTNKGLNVYKTQAAGSGLVGSRLRNLYINDREKDILKPIISAIMHSDHYSDVIKNLTFSDFVISDRWIGCFYAYNVHTFNQTGAIEIFFNVLKNKIVMRRTPDLIIHVDANNEVIEKRLKSRINNNLDTKSLSLLNTIKEGYLNFYLDYPGKVAYIENNLDTEILASKITDITDHLLGL